MQAETPICRALAGPAPRSARAGPGRRRRPRCRWLVCAAGCLLAADVCRAADLLGLSHDLASALRGEVLDRLARTVATGRWDFSPLALRVPPPDEEGAVRLVLRSPGGRTWVPDRSSPTHPLCDQLAVFPGRHGLYDRTRREPYGVGTYYSLDPDLRHVVRVDVGWSAITDAATGWVLAVEHERPVQTVRGAPWAGRWIGAYSDDEVVLDAGGRAETLPRRGGGLSGLVHQEAAWCALRLSASDWSLSGAGIVVDQVLVVSGRFSDGLPWLLELTHTPQEAELRGRLTGATPQRLLQRSVFLQRAPPVD